VLVTVHPHASRPVSHLVGCVGFWLWALVGAGMVIGLTSFIVFFLIPPIVMAVLLVRLSRWSEGPVLLGLIAGAGVSLLLVAGLNWSEWHHRSVGDGIPNPYDWGGVGLCLLAAGVVAYSFVRHRRD
jgi:drug/metabolite transporter superfamily protein YnfA